jgi:hypothetical protein
MANGYTVFFSYLLVPDSGDTTGCGYSEAIHCNYINSIYLDSITNKEVNINFSDINDFKFLVVSGGSGFTANKMFILTQLINNSTYTNLSDVKPISANWKLYEVTNQMSGYSTGSTYTITPASISTAVFGVPLYLYNAMLPYNLSYLNYPTHLAIDDNKLCFGEEEFFMGNINSDIEAIAYTTDLAIKLSLNEFNSTSNATWGGQQVYITEVGIYDVNKNLIAIAKLNDPIPKDSAISRTILFGLDF